MLRWPCAAPPTSSFSARLEIHGLVASQEPNPLQPGSHFIQVSWNPGKNHHKGGKGAGCVRSALLDSETLGGARSPYAAPYVFQRAVDLAVGVGRNGFAERPVRVSLFRLDPQPPPLPPRPLSAGSSPANPPQPAAADAKERRNAAVGSRSAGAHSETILGEVSIDLAEFASGPDASVHDAPAIFAFPPGCPLAGAALSVTVTVSALPAGAEAVPELPLPAESAWALQAAEPHGAGAADSPDSPGHSGPAGPGADGDGDAPLLPSTPDEEPPTPRGALTCAPSRRSLLDPLLFRRRLDAAAGAAAAEAGTHAPLRSRSEEGPVPAVPADAAGAHGAAQPPPQQHGGGWWSPWGGRRGAAAGGSAAGQPAGPAGEVGEHRELEGPAPLPRIRSVPSFTAASGDPEQSPRKRARPPTPADGQQARLSVGRLSDSAARTSGGSAVPPLPRAASQDGSASGKTRRESLTDEIAAGDAASGSPPSTSAPASAAQDGASADGKPPAPANPGRRWWQIRPPRGGHRRSASAPMDLEGPLPGPLASFPLGAGASAPGSPTGASAAAAAAGGAAGSGPAQDGPSSPGKGAAAYRRIQTEEDFERDLKRAIEISAAIAEGRHVPAAIQLSRADQKRQRGSATGSAHGSSADLAALGGGDAAQAPGLGPGPAAALAAVRSPPGTPVQPRDASAAGRRITEEEAPCSTPGGGALGAGSGLRGAETPLVLRTASLELSPFRSSRVCADGGEWLQLELRSPFFASGEQPAGASAGPPAEAPGPAPAAEAAPAAAPPGAEQAEQAASAPEGAAAGAPPPEPAPAPGPPSIRAEVFFGGIDQCCGEEGERGTGACSVLAFCVSAWLLEHPGRVPTSGGGSELDALVRAGSRAWREMLAGDPALQQRFDNGHLDLDSVLSHQLPSRPLGVTLVPSEGFITFVRPPSVGAGECPALDFLTEGSLPLDEVFAQLRRSAPGTFIVAWNDHFFVLQVEAEEVYLIDTLGERLYEGNRRAYVLCFNGEDGHGGTAMAARFIRDFVGAAPLGQLAEDLKCVGPRHFEAADPEHLMRRTQIEFHYVRRV